jgi:hypothetical protein
MEMLSHIGKRTINFGGPGSGPHKEGEARETTFVDHYSARNFHQDAASNLRNRNPAAAALHDKAASAHNDVIGGAYGKNLMTGPNPERVAIARDASQAAFKADGRKTAPAGAAFTV